MAVDQNPYEKWEQLKASSDYRSTDTQISSLVRQQLSGKEYLRDYNRVNPGPHRNLRANVADSRPQIPHPLGSEDMWGWQQWAKNDITTASQSNLAENLLKDGEKASIPGATYDPSWEVGGASA